MSQSTVLTSLADAVESGDEIRFWREPRYHGLEGLSATFRSYRYVPHTHETYAVAAIVSGCEAFRHRGERHYAPAGSIGLINPDEWHDGEPAGAAFAYRTLYPSVELMRSVAEDLFGRPVAGTPRFAASVVADADLSGRLAAVHATLADAAAPLIERDEGLVAVLVELLRRHGDLGVPVPVGQESAAVRRVRDYLEAEIAADPGLDDLAALAGLNRAHLVRVFRKATGTTPHAYLVDRRVRAARRLLARGEAPAEVAAACGFCDQSHLNRAFKARLAVTPGLYRA